MNYKIGLLILTLFSCSNHDIKFDSGKWKNAGGENISLDTRLNMTNDLIESKALINKNESKIIDIIDSPSRIHGKEVDTIKYFAVQEIYGWDIDPKEMTFLKIVFNEKRRSTSVELYSTK